MVGFPLYYLILLKEFIKESLNIQKARKLNSSTIKRQIKHDITSIFRSKKESHLASSTHQVMGFIPTINIGCNSNLKHMMIYETILIIKEIWHSSLERD